MPFASHTQLTGHQKASACYESLQPPPTPRRDRWWLQRYLFLRIVATATYNRRDLVLQPPSTPGDLPQEWRAHK